MVAIPNVGDCEGKLYCFSNGKLLPAGEYSNRGGLVATIGLGDNHGQIFLSKAGNLVAIEAYAYTDSETAFCCAVLERQLNKDDAATAQQVVDKLLKSPIRNRPPLGLSQHVHCGEQLVETEPA